MLRLTQLPEMTKPMAYIRAPQASSFEPRQFRPIVGRPRSFRSPLSTRQAVNHPPPRSPIRAKPYLMGFPLLPLIYWEHTILSVCTPTSFVNDTLHWLQHATVCLVSCRNCPRRVQPIVGAAGTTCSFGSTAIHL